MIEVFMRAFVIVTLTALNVTQVSDHHFLGAFFTGGTLSFVWWKNAQKASVSLKMKNGALAYALGAACGTDFGMFLGRILG